MEKPPENKTELEALDRGLCASLSVLDVSMPQADEKISTASERNEIRLKCMWFAVSTGQSPNSAFWATSTVHSRFGD